MQPSGPSSVTLDPAHLCTTTTVAISPSFDQDRMWLNGKVLFLSLSLSLSLSEFCVCLLGKKLKEIWIDFMFIID